jgi:hypothetical protein|tara:strand:+ start:343 stop:699 length:357 start_codon:yes stop_codon:yes gene_type:complete
LVALEVVFVLLLAFAVLVFGFLDLHVPPSLFLATFFALGLGDAGGVVGGDSAEVGDGGDEMFRFGCGIVVLDVNSSMAPSAWGREDREVGVSALSRDDSHGTDVIVSSFGTTRRTLDG